jgi:hypothetical protein
LLSQYTIPATEDAPEKVRYVLAAISGLEDTRRLVDASDIATANDYLELGWRLIEKYVTTPDSSGEPNGASEQQGPGEKFGGEEPGGDIARAELQPEPRKEQIHFVLAWQREEEPPTPGIDAPRLLREHVTQFDSREEIPVEP